MKKLPIILLFLIACFILFFAIFLHIHPQSTKTIIGAQTIIPIVPGSEPVQEKKEKVLYDNLNITSMIPLEENETLLGTYTIDFDKDGYEDQIISVKDTTSRYIKVILGLYNTVYASFERTVILQTTIDQVQSFSFYVQDITATHTNTLILTGFDSNNNSVMKIYMPSRTSNNLTLNCVLDLSADGTIFIQQVLQSTSYDLGQTDGVSFPVWVYKPDPDASEGSLDQIQIEYVWNKNNYAYEKDIVNKITGKSITAQELRTIQDGTITTFADFLTGLWEKTSSSNTESRFISFDYPALTINFATQGTQEVYNWNQSTLRRTGILLLLINNDIPNLTRRFNISLVSTDEINVKIADNVGMTIGANPLWDGNYKKVITKTAPLVAKEEKTNATLETLLKTNNTNWITNTNYSLDFTETSFKATPIIDKDISTKITPPIETGVLSKLTVHNEEFLELRSSLAKSKFTGIYKILSTEKIGENATSLQIKLIPVTVTTNIIEEKNSLPLILTQTIKNKK